MKTHSHTTGNRHMFSHQMKRLHSGERKHVKEIFAWADKSSIDRGDRDRICERARQINFNIDTSALSDEFRFADEVNALFREIERLDPIGYAKMQRRLTKRLQKKA